ncbi:MAG: TonB family protein [Candidatus Melainabacteria bacterium]|nr:MAG: TonB family protein [Candidatus Melainabacteria bacterium]
MGQHYDRGIICYQNKQYKHAEKEFREELASAPDSAAAHAMLGMTLVALRKGEQGHKEALEAVRLFPDYAYGHYTLSYSFAAINKPKESEKAIVEAIRIQPEEAYLFGRAAQIYMNQKKYQRALEMADIGLSFEPDNEECLINRGGALLELNKLPEAEVTLQQALAVDPESYTAHINMGATQLRLMKHAEAFTHYREALRLNPNSEQARLGVLESLKAKNPLYHGMLRFSIFCRTLPPPVVVCALLLLIFPPTRLIIVAIFGAYAVANYMFELALHLDPVGRDFVSDRKEKTLKRLKELTVPLLMIVCGLGIAIGAALAPTTDKNYRHRHRAAVKEEPVQSMKFDSFVPYMAYVETRIKRNWHPPSMTKSMSVLVHFNLDKNGNMSNEKVVESSGDEQMDKAAIAALKAAAPFPKLPPGNEKPVEVQFRFQYNVSNSATEKNAPDQSATDKKSTASPQSATDKKSVLSPQPATEQKSITNPQSGKTKE